MTPFVSIFKSSLARNVLKVATGNVAGNFLQFLAFVVVGTQLDPPLFGIFYTVLTTMLLIAQISDFGIGTSIVKYYRDLEVDGRRTEAEALLRRTFWIRLVCVVALAGIAMLLPGSIVIRVFSDEIAAGFMTDREAVRLFRLACLGAIGSGLWMYCQSSMQARQRYTAYSLLTAANHALRLLLVLALIPMHALNVDNVVYVLVAIPFFGAMGASLLAPREFWTASMDAVQLRAQSARMFRMTRWIFLSTVTVTLIMRLDVLYLQWFADARETGLYGMAKIIAEPFPMLAMAVSAVLLPTIAATRKRGEMLQFMNYFVRAIPFVAVAAAAAMLAAWLVLPLLRGGQYAPALPLFNMLLVGFALSLIVNPLSFFCLAFEKAQWLTWMNLLQLALHAGICLLFIPLWGAMAAAIASSSVRALALVYLLVAFRRLLAGAED